MKQLDLSSDILHGTVYTWLTLIETTLLSALIYAQLRASNLTEPTSYAVAMILLIISILVPHVIAPRPFQYKRRLRLVHNYVIPVLIVVWLVALAISINSDTDAGSELIKVVTVSFVGPIFFLVLLLINVLLIGKSSSIVQRWRGISGAVAGGIIGLIAVLIARQSIASGSSSFLNVGNLLTVILIFSIAGFLVVLVLDVLLKIGAVALISMVTAAFSIISVFLLTWSTTIFTILAVGFLFGNTLYLAIVPARIINHFKSGSEDND